MRKKTVAFIDHSAHAVTGSSAFFRHTLEDRFVVEILYVSPDKPIDRQTVEAAGTRDIVVIWQMDFLAPIFIAKGLPTVVVPMYDGSANMPDLHWNWARQAYFICFSWTLYDRLRLLGCKVYLSKYFTVPVSEKELPSFQDYNVFLWQRRPEDGIHGDMVARLLGDQVDSLHIHNAPDDPHIDGSKYYKHAYRYNLTISNWFEHRSEYDLCLSRANIFVSPRRAEGIGMAHLEAMARGMLVLAHDLPTHTEYLANWVNGVLFNADDIGFADIPRDRARTMARSGWLTAVEGRREWDDMRSSLLDFVGDAPSPSCIDGDLFETLVCSLPQAYSNGFDGYVRYLEDSRKIILSMSGSVVDPVAEPRRDIALIAPALRDCTIVFSSGQGRPYMLGGWGHNEAEAVWIVARAADVAFHWVDAQTVLETISITCRSLAEIGDPILVVITLNDEVVGSFRAQSRWTNYLLHGFRLKAISLNRLSIFVSRSVRLPEDGRDLSIMVQKIAFNVPIDFGNSGI